MRSLSVASLGYSEAVFSARPLVVTVLAILPLAFGCSSGGDDSDKSGSAKPKQAVKPKPVAKPKQVTKPKRGTTPDAGTAVATKPPPPAGHDFAAEARLLFRTAVCRGDQPLPTHIPAQFMKRQCAFLADIIARYKTRWLAKARPFFDKHVPKDASTKIVYPFGGGDLLTALSVFPDLSEVTTMSLEPSGDPRTINTISRARFLAYWKRARRFVNTLLTAIHSRTVDMTEAMNFGRLPGEVIFSLLALAIHDLEPVSLRYFAVEPDGKLHYYTLAEITAADKAIADAKPGKARRKAGLARRDMFRHMELQFRKPGGAIKLHRHMRADLGDKALGKDRRMISHLESKGSVTGMTKAASYLLWHNTFSIVRNYLLKHVDWMVSDATGVPPRYGKKAGFEYETYGRFVSHIRHMSNPGPATIAELQRLWASQKRRRIPFRFGYSGGFDYKLWHLMIMKRKPGKSRHGHTGHFKHRFTDAKKWAARFDDPKRDAWQKPAHVIGLLGIKAGMTVADIGAGTGYFTSHLSRTVGKAGVVVAVDVEAEMVRYLIDRAKRDKLVNVTGKVVQPSEPGLDANSVDRVIIVNTWHHIADRVAYTRKLAAALKPGGLIAVIDYTKKAPHGPPAKHRLTPAQVMKELTAGGLKAEQLSNGLPHQYIVVGKR